MIVYKLTDKDGRTFGDCQWGEGISRKTKKEGATLCTDEVIHAYRDPYLAIFANPIQGGFDSETMLLWECEASNPVADDGLKIGVKELTTIRQIPIPCLSTEQIIKIAILSAKEVYKNKRWNKWADGWLSGEDRTLAAAAIAAHDAADAAVHTYATEAVAYPAYSAYSTARAAVRAATYATEAVAYATEAAAFSTARARAAGDSKYPDILAIILKVVKGQK